MTTLDNTISSWDHCQAPGFADFCSLKYPTVQKWFMCMTAGDGLPQPMSHSKHFWTGWSSLRTGPPHGWWERPPQDSGVPEVSPSEHLCFYKEGPRHPKQSPRGWGFGSLNWQACDWTLLAFQELRNLLATLWGWPEAPGLALLQRKASSPLPSVLARAHLSDVVWHLATFSGNLAAQVPKEGFLLQALHLGSILQRQISSWSLTSCDWHNPKREQTPSLYPTWHLVYIRDWLTNDCWDR